MDPNSPWGGFPLKNRRFSAAERETILLKFPVQNILVYAPGGISVRARYRHSRLPLGLAREKNTHQSNVPFGRQVKITDMGLSRLPSLPETGYPWPNLIRRGVDDFGAATAGGYDYPAIIEAINAIRGVHGQRIPVVWNLIGPKIETLDDLEFEAGAAHPEMVTLTPDQYRANRATKWAEWWSDLGHSMTHGRGCSCIINYDQFLAEIVT